MYLTPTVTMHKMPNDMPPRLAALYNPLGAGFDWAVTTPQLQVGQSIAILGPGQRGLCSVVAARAAGAGQIIVTGLARDEHKLALAREFGADLTIDVDAQPTVARVLEATDGRGVDVVLDVTAYATQPVADALKMVKRGGTVVLAGLKGSHRLPDFNSDDIILRQVTVKGVLGVDYHSFRRAIDVINSGAVPLEQMHTHAFPLDQAEQAIATLAGETAAPRRQRHHRTLAEQLTPTVTSPPRLRHTRLRAGIHTATVGDAAYRDVLRTGVGGVPGILALRVGVGFGPPNQVWGRLPINAGATEWRLEGT